MFISSSTSLNVIYSKNYRGPWQTSSAATANYCNFSRGTAIPPSRHYPALNLESSYQQYHQSIKEQVSSDDNQYQYPYGSIGEFRERPNCSGSAEREKKSNLKCVFG